MAAEPKAYEGRTPSGTRYLIEVPPAWNEALLLYSRGLPAGPDDRPWEPGGALFPALLDEGYALAGCGGSDFWPLEQVFSNQAALLDTFESEVGRPRRTIAWGLSIGGIMSAGLVQVMPERLSGALPLCGNLAGAIAIHNRELDISFVLRTLLAPDSALRLVEIGGPDENLGLALELLEEARRTPAGRARLALAAAVGNIPGWFDPTSSEPAASDFEQRLRNQIGWYEEPGFLVYFALREQVERQAGGNPSWNVGVDYAALLLASINRDQVEGLYATAGLELSEDLGRLAAEPRIEADPEAISYLERNIVFSGDLGGVPVLSMHTGGDGLVTPDNQHAYADVVASAGQEHLLRQLYVNRGGHCTFTVAEIRVALDVLERRIEGGSWPALDPDELNVAASALGPDSAVMAWRDTALEPAFFDFDPPPFGRAYDMRSIAARKTAGGS